MAGREKGKQGVVTKCLRQDNRVLIQGLNMVLERYSKITSKIKKHIKGNNERKGGIFAMEAPLHVSNVSLLDPMDG